MSTIRLVLVRHGYSLGNELHLLSGWTDVPLTPQGRAELRELRQTHDYPATEYYLSSDLSRCTETFSILYDGKAALNRKNSQFREIYFGQLENSTEEQVASKQFFTRWIKKERITTEESFDEFKMRIYNALEDLLSDCIVKHRNSVTLVTHSGVIRILLLMLQDLEPQDFFKIPSPNGLGYILQLQKDENGISLLHCEDIAKKENI